MNPALTSQEKITIKDLERFSGIKAPTLRIWEKRYHFFKPARTKTNIRYYSLEELKIVLNAGLLTRFGFKVSQFDKMRAAQIEASAKAIKGLEAVRERLVNSLIFEMAALDENKFESLLGNHSDLNGLEDTLHQIVLPFVERTGIFWRSGEISPAQEQLAVNIIRQKLILAIETMDKPLSSQKPPGKKALVFLPEGIYQEIGSLFTYYLLKQRGIEVIYLGPSVPLKDVEFIVKRKNPVILFIHFPGPAAAVQIGQFVTDIRYRLGATPTIVSGLPVLNFRKILPAGIQFKTSLRQLLESINSV